jgi:hypothetical protein
MPYLHAQMLILVQGVCQSPKWLSLAEPKHHGRYHALSTLREFLSVCVVSVYTNTNIHAGSLQQTCFNNSATLLANDGMPVPFHVCL